MKRHPVKRALRATGRAIQAVEFWLTPERVTRRRTMANNLKFQELRLSSREAGDLDRFRGSKWITSRLSPDSEAEADLEDIRDRARDLYLNDPIFAGYVKSRVTQVVGMGFTLQARIKEGDGISAERARDLNKTLEALWKRQARRIGISGTRSFWQIQRLAQRCLDRDGEAFVVMSDRPVKGKPVPLALEVVTVSRVATPPEKESNPRIRLGIERDVYGVPTHYYIRVTDPDDTKLVSETFRRVPAARVMHLYEEEEPGQSRGCPSASCVLNTLKDLKDYNEAALMKRQTEACFAAFVEVAEGASPAVVAAAASHDTNSNNNRLQELVPGTIEYLGAGEKITFATPSGNGADQANYLDSQHHGVAAGLNFPYEQLTKAWGKANYASSRTALLEGHAEARVWQKLQTETICLPVWEEFVLQCIQARLVEITAVEYRKTPWLFDACAFIPTGWDWVDPLKEVKAANEAIGGGIECRTDVVQSRGQDDEEVQERRVQEQMRDADNEKRVKDYRKKLGLDEPPEPKPGEAKPDKPEEDDGPEEEEGE